LIDLHNHIIRYMLPIHPRVAPDPEIAVRMAEVAAEDGARIIVSTPHFRPSHMQEDWLPRLRDAIAELNDLLAMRDIPIEVVGGAEVEMSEMLPEVARKGWLPTLGESKHVLIELPIVTYAAYAEEILFKLALQGYTPVLAHFERLALAVSRPADPRTLVERGYKIQVNCESLRGKRGAEVQNLARTLIREDLVSCLGSDAHDPDDRPPGLSACRRDIEQFGGRGSFDRLTWDSPLEIIGQRRGIGNRE